MLLTTALFRSDQGIATRRRLVSAAKSDRPARYEYQMAALSPKGIVHIHNGRNGTIRRMEGADQTYTDWEPFAPAELSSKKRIRVPKDLK